MDYEKIGNFLFTLRKSRNLSQKQLGLRFYISREAISKWERGISLPDYPSLIALSKFYNITINEILAGEKIDEHNRDRIEAVALTILENSERKIRRSRLINVIVFLIAILILLSVYFYYNYNSIHIYTLYSYNQEFSLDDGEMFIYQNKVYFKLGLIHKSNGDVLTNNDNHEVIIYYGKDNKRILLNSTDVENLYINLNTFDNLIEEVSLDYFLDNLFIDIINDNNISTMKLEKELFYSNNYKAYFTTTTELYSAKETIDLERKVKPNYIMIDNKKYTYKIYDDSIELYCEEDKTLPKYKYYCAYNQINIKIDENKLQVYSYTSNTCLTPNCEPYLSTINYIRNNLINKVGLS